MTTIYKVLGENGQPHNGGSEQWHLPKGKRPGRWMPKIKKIIPCESGYHLCEGETQLLEWLAPTIWVAEYRGEKREHDGTKIVVGEARLIRKCENWNERTARLFAADCAEDALPIYEKHYPNDDRPRKAIGAAREFANGEIGREEMDAASAAAWAAASAAWDAASAAWDAASAAAWDAASAAWDAASVAAWAAARDAAWAAASAAWAAASAAWAAASAAWAAARDAASAARAAAWDAAIKKQATRLRALLGEPGNG